MKLCTGNDLYHGEIVYEGKNCPLCEALNEIVKKEKEIIALEERKFEDD